MENNNHATSYFCLNWPWQHRVKLPKCRSVFPATSEALNMDSHWAKPLLKLLIHQAAIHLRLSLLEEARC